MGKLEALSDLIAVGVVGVLGFLVLNLIKGAATGISGIGEVFDPSKTAEEVFAGPFQSLARLETQLAGMQTTYEGIKGGIIEVIGEKGYELAKKGEYAYPGPSDNGNGSGTGVDGGVIPRADIVQVIRHGIYKR